MIGWAVDLIVEHVVTPQTYGTVPDDRRVYLDPASTPLDADPQEVDVAPVTTRPVSYEIGGGVEVEHVVSVAVDVQHGDPVESRRRRDLIVLDLALRAVDQLPTLLAAVDPATGQAATRVEWAVDYAPLTTGESDTNESAVVTFTITAQLDR